MKQPATRRHLRFLSGFFVFLTTGASVGLVACSDPKEKQEDPRLALLHSWGEHIIVPQYEEVLARAQVLKEKSAALCDSPDADALKEAQDAWWDLREPWKENEIIKFGPYREEPLRLGPKLDFWPSRLDSVEGVLLDTTPLDAEVVSAFGATLRGMPPTEYLLYASEGEVEVDFAPLGRRCEYLLAITEDLTNLAQSMRDAWHPDAGNFVAELTDPENGKTFATVLLAVSEVANRLSFTLEDMRGDRLGRPLGEQSGGVPQPDLVESRPSGRSIVDLLDTLSGVEAFFFGAAEPEEALGLADFLPTEPRDFHAEMRAHLAACRSALQALEPLATSISEHPELVVAAGDALSDLQRFLQVDVMGELGLSVSLNDNDGD